jgi:hypothetical protein
VHESHTGNDASAGHAAANLGHGGYLKVEVGTRHVKQYVWGLRLRFT